MAQAARDYDGMEEHALVAHAVQGDREAFRAIMKRGNQRLFRVARAVMGNDEEAEDVLQAAWLAAFHGLSGFRGEAGLLTWLTAITLNEARARLRKRRPMLALDMLDRGAPQIVAFPGSAPPSDPEAEAGRAQMRTVLESGIDELPPDFRVVFILREIEGCSVEETARQLAIAPATVKTRHFRARRLLRRALERRFAAGLGGIFPFLGARCDRICESVLRRLG